MRFDLVDLRLFVNIVEAGSITAGARASHLSAGSGSARLSEMEESLGQKLLIRGKAGVEPTPPGLALLGHARVILGQVEQLQSDLSAYAAGHKVQLKILCNTSSASESLPPLLSQFLVQHPNVSIDLEEHPSVDIVRLVSSGSWHIGVISDAVAPQALHTLPFQPDLLVAITPCGHPLAANAQGKQISFADCLEYDFVGLTGESALYQHLATHAAQAGRRLKLKARIRDLDGVCRMVANGVGISVVPHRTALRNMETTPVDIAALMDEWAARTLRLCFRRLDELPPQGRALVEFLSTAVRT